MRKNNRFIFSLSQHCCWRIRMKNENWWSAKVNSTPTRDGLLTKEISKNDEFTNEKKRITCSPAWEDELQTAREDYLTTTQRETLVLNESFTRTPPPVRWSRGRRWPLTFSLVVERQIYPCVVDRDRAVVQCQSKPERKQRSSSYSPVTQMVCERLMEMQVLVEQEWNWVFVPKVTVGFVVNNELPWVLKQSEVKKRQREENTPYWWGVVLFVSSLSVFSLLQLVSAGDNIRVQ